MNDTETQSQEDVQWYTATYRIEGIGHSEETTECFPAKSLEEARANAEKTSHGRPTDTCELVKVEEGCL